MLAELQLKARVEVTRRIPSSLTRKKMNLDFQAYPLADGKPPRKPGLQAAKRQEVLVTMEEASKLLREAAGERTAATLQKSEEYLVTPQPGL